VLRGEVEGWGLAPDPAGAIHEHCLAFQTLDVLVHPPAPRIENLL
jgi:hypothetical protein